MLDDLRQIHPMIDHKALLKDNELFEDILKSIKIVLDYEQLHTDHFPGVVKCLFRWLFWSAEVGLCLVHVLS